MADQYFLPQHPHGEKDAVHTMILLLNFLQSPDFQYRSGRRVDITARFGDIDAGTYLEIEDDGFIEVVGTEVWDDVRVPISGVRLPAAAAPTWTAYKGSQVLAFDGTSTDTIFVVVQLPHMYKQGTDIDVHVHWVPEDATAGNVKWQVTYSWANWSEAFPAETTATVVVAAPEVADVHTKADIIETISGTGKTISSMLLCSLSRLGGDVEDTYNAKDAYLLEVDFHYQKDTLGSRTETVK